MGGGAVSATTSISSKPALMISGWMVVPMSISAYTTILKEAQGGKIDREILAIWTLSTLILFSGTTLLPAGFAVRSLFLIVRHITIGYLV